MGDYVDVVDNDLQDADSDIRSKYEDFVIPEPDEREDSDRDESTLVSASAEMTEISIHTAQNHAGFMQIISNPLSLKFVDLDDSSDEIKEEEAHERDDDTGVEDDECFLSEGDSDNL